ncbi:MAG TPA: phage head-tail connector protein [Gemmataceae bacterium]|nr:phage head-tail connector protein [Gemmataceae bacterium]
MSLDTLANVKARLGIATSADDTLLGLLQDSADKAVENYCNRDFAGGTYTEYHPGGSEFVHLRNYPVDAVTSVKVDATRAFGAETLVSASDYVVHADRGVIQSVAGPFLPRGRDGLVNATVRAWTRGPRVVQVVYSTLTGQVPADVKEAYARLVGHWYRQVKTESAASFQNVMQQKVGETFTIFGGEGAGAGLPAEVAELLAPYRVPLA